MFAPPRILDPAMPRLGFVNMMAMMMMMMMVKLPILVCAEKLVSETTIETSYVIFQTILLPVTFNNRQ